MSRGFYMARVAVALQENESKLQWEGPKGFSSTKFWSLLLMLRQREMQEDPVAYKGHLDRLEVRTSDI